MQLLSAALDLPHVGIVVHSARLVGNLSTSNRGLDMCSVLLDRLVNLAEDYMYGFKLLKFSKIKITIFLNF